MNSIRYTQLDDATGADFDTQQRPCEIEQAQQEVIDISRLSKDSVVEDEGVFHYEQDHESLEEEVFELHT